jgi:hypothetical protein
LKVIGLEEVLCDPHGVAGRLLEAGIYGLTEVDVRVTDRECVILRLTLEPWAQMAELGYPTERVSVLVQKSGWICAVPLDQGRIWAHRYGPPLRELCLWFPEDSLSLRWTWDQGLVSYVRIVHRHLQAEECWRRHGFWPAEDAPHGAGPHAVQSLELREAVSGGSRSWTSS